MPVVIPVAKFGFLSSPHEVMETEDAEDNYHFYENIHSMTNIFLSLPLFEHVKNAHKLNLYLYGNF